MVVGEASIHNIMGGMESTGGVRLHNHKRKLKQRFDIIKKLGQGTYGKVQLGINKETGQEVAIKTIKKCKIETEADLIRIRREIQIMSSVQHPNIIHIYEVFENREKMVLVMEYAAGGELYDYLSERKVLSEHEARRIFRQIATAVFYCHKHKICHRDLKLENILLDQAGNAKIADFGLSNVFDEQRLLNTFCGSPLYASPEIVKGTPYHGPEVDCWSLGVLLYTLVYGAMPFDGSNFKRLVKQISQSDYFEPKKPSPASPLIKDMLTVMPAKRADIEKICTHWWVNEGYEQNCLDIAEELAAQTPVRLDLLLSLVPQSASAEKLVVGDDRQGAGDVGNNVSSETLVPTRCHSLESLMGLVRSDSDRRDSRIKKMLLMEDEESRSAQVSSGDAKRKLETTPSMEETTAAGVKRKERSRRKERTEEREPRAYRSGSRHHSAPIPNAITEEAMEVDPVVVVPPSDDPNGADATAGSLELIKECNERSPSKERSKTPISTPSSQKLEEPVADAPMDDATKTTADDREEKLAEEDVAMRCESVRSGQSHAATLDDRSKAVSKSETSKARLSGGEGFVGHDSVSLEATQREFKKLKEKALSLDSDLSTEPRDVPARTFERRRSKIFETAEKFNQMASSTETEKPKKIFIPGVNVGGAKRVFERKASLSSIGAPPPAKPSASKVIIDVPTEKRTDKSVEQPKQSRETRNEEQQQQQQQQPQQQEDEEEKKKEDAKKRAVDIITGAIGKPPVQRRVNGSPPVSPPGHEPKKLPLKIPVGANDLRTATVSVSTPVDTNFSFDQSAYSDKQASISGGAAATSTNDREMDDAQPEEPRMSSKMEITLKSATLPRQRKTSKAEISLSGAKSSEPVAFRSEVAAKIDAFQPQKLRTQRSEVAFPVAAAIPQTHRSASLEPDTRHAAATATPKERIIPIQVEGDTERDRSSQHSSTPPTPPTPVSAAPKPPIAQRSVSQRSGSLSRQSTADSDTDSALGSTIGPEPIRKSPREYIIPIAVEGGGYVTPRSGSVEPESKTSTSTSASASASTNASRSRFTRPRRMSSLLSDASEDESPFSTLHRDSEDLLQRHMHRLRSSRPSRQPPEHADSLSSGEDDDDDGFELLTAENLFSTLLSRVRSLTQRLNVDDNRNAGFPSSRLFGRLGPNTSQTFWGLNKPLSRRLTESQFRHSLSRDGDAFSRKDSVDSNPGSPGTTHGSNSASTRETVFDIGNNTLPRDRVERDDAEAVADALAGPETEAESEPTATTTPARVTKDARDSLESMEPGLEHGFTPSLAKRLSRSFIEQTRRPLPYEKRYRRSIEAPIEPTSPPTIEIDTVSDRTEYKEHRPSANTTVRRSNSLLESTSTGRDASYRASPIPRRSVSLFDDDYYNYDYDYDVDETIGRERDLRTSTVPFSKNAVRKYKENATAAGKHRRENFHSYRTDKIQEETSVDEAFGFPCRSEADQLESYATDNGSVSEMPSSVSTKSYDTSPTTESSSNALDYTRFSYAGKSDQSRSFENRLLAAENLIKESKLRNLGSNRFDPNLCSSYRDTDKCEKQSLISIDETTGSSSAVAKRRSCIPSLRFRSGSLTRDPTGTVDRRKSFADTRDLGCVAARAYTPEKSILSKFFKPSGSRDADSKQREKDKDSEREKEKPQKSKQHRISRFLRPDFFDTPREESKYAKEKEERKAAENERRKSRFMKRKGESVEQEKRDKELKNEINALRKDSQPNPSEEKREKDASSATTTTTVVEQDDAKKIERHGSRNSFLHSLEKKLERLRSNEDATATPSTTTTKLVANGGIASESRERSAPPGEVRSDAEAGSLQKAVSVEDLTASRKPVGRTSSKSKVSSVLGLFRSTDAKQTANTIGSRTQNAILGRLKKSPPKSAKSEVAVPGEDASSCANGANNGSRIPTKLSTKNEAKSTKKFVGEGKKSVAAPEKPGSESPKRSPPKEKPPIAKERRASSEKETTKVAANSARSTDRESADASRDKSNGEAKRSTEESAEKKEEAANGNGGTIEKKVLKTRKNRSLAETGSSTGEPTKRDDSDKKPVKKMAAKIGETGEGNDVDGTKKKRTTRTVKKFVKKASSDGSDDKPEDPGKPGKPRTKKKLIGAVEPASSSESSMKIPGKSKENGTVESQANGKSSARSSVADAKPSSKSDPQESDRNGSGRTVSKPSTVSETKPNNGQSKPQESQRANRTNLKLDLSKIPQHSFRNTTPKRDSPNKSESPMISSVGDSPKTSDDKLVECLSKVTHRASITGNKIVIDKPLRAKDVAELKREVTECAKMIESHVEAGNEKAAKAQQRKATPPLLKKDEDVFEEKEIEANRMESTVTAASEHQVSPDDPPTIKQPWKESPTDFTNDPFSPVDEPESFDSWSVSSTELNHARQDLRSPTSPSHSLYSRVSDSSAAESVIDRIRRRSFYSRFNDRRRPSLTAPPPGLGLSTSAASLPRKYSFSGHREHRDRNKYGSGTGTSYGLAAIGRTRQGDHYHRTRSFDLYADDAIGSRNRSLERARYSDASVASSPYIVESRSSIEQLPPLSSSYDPLRRYIRSPTFDLSSSRTRYHSADFSVDSDLASYRSPFSGLLAESAVEGHAIGSFGSSSTLPRKYGSSAKEPKTVEYYEELLAPTVGSTDFLQIRKSPISGEYSSRCENGFYNGSKEPRSTGSATKRKPYEENSNAADVGAQREQEEERFVERARSRSGSTSASVSISASASTSDRQNEAVHHPPMFVEPTITRAAGGSDRS
ncbi:nuak family kinase 1 isoform X2 [Halictus rubicundus]|uniref:nuak family kinase 1 isoform X2 n=1 Tax=Halictus rubicundus TaxID=77578 RepID=UPI004035C011